MLRIVEQLGLFRGSRRCFLIMGCGFLGDNGSLHSIMYCVVERRASSSMSISRLSFITISATSLTFCLCSKGWPISSSPALETPSPTRAFMSCSSLPALSTGDSATSVLEGMLASVAANDSSFVPLVTALTSLEFK